MTARETIISSAKRTLTWTMAALSKSQPSYLAALFCNINSQVTKMASFLLPIKVLYIAAAPNIPSYLSRFAPTFSREELVLSLSTLAILLFVMHVVFEWARNTLEQHQFTLFFAELQKNPDPINQQRTRALYRHCLAFLSGTVFSILLIILLGIIAHELIVLLLGLILVAGLLIEIFDKTLQATWGSSPQAASTAIGVFCAIGFLSGFGVILLTLLNKEEASVVISIVSLIAFRLLMNQLGLISNAINYHGKSGFDIESQFEKPAVTPIDRTQHQDQPGKSRELETTLRESFECYHNKQFLIKQIDASTLQAESYLIQNPEKNSTFSLLTISSGSRIRGHNASDFNTLHHNHGLAPEVKAASSIQGKNWTIYEGPIIDIPLDEHPKAKRDFLANLAATPIEGIPESIFTESLLNKNLSASEICKAIQRYDINAARINEIEDLIEHCKSLLLTHPMQLQLRSNQGSLVYDMLRNPLAINWDQCELVPVGTSFGGETLIFDPVEIVQTASKTRADLKELSEEAILLAYEVGRLTAALQRNRYSSITHITAKIASLTKAL